MAPNIDKILVTGPTVWIQEKVERQAKTNSSTPKPQKLNPVIIAFLFFFFVTKQLWK